jgi:molybdopterin/thiamine biosynthesis adenylyltransferase
VDAGALSTGSIETSERPWLREIHARRGRALDLVLDLDRSVRAPGLLGVAQDVGAALRELDLVVVGLGAVGLHLADAAARLGVRSLVLVDGARLKVESLLTHRCGPREVGRSKARVAAERGKALSPTTRVLSFEGPVEDLPTCVLASASWILLATDNLAAEIRVAQSALHLGVPLVQASVHGATLTAAVRSLAPVEGDEGPCLACAYSSREWAQLDEGTRFSCDGPAGAGAAPDRSRVPTTSWPFVCALAANLAWMELVRRTAGIGGDGESRLIEYEGARHRTFVTPLAHAAGCPLDHRGDRLVPRDGDLAASTPRELLRDAGYADADLRRTTLTVEGFRYASLATCSCSAHPRLGRFFRAGGALGPCRRCGRPQVPHPLHQYQEAPFSSLEGGIDTPLDALGAPGASSVRVRGNGEAVRFYRRVLPKGALPR